MNKEILATLNLSIPKEISYSNQIKYSRSDKYACVSSR